MTGKYDEHDTNRQRYHGKRRNATTSFNYQKRSNEEDKTDRPGPSGMRSGFDHSRIGGGGGISQRKHSNNRFGTHNRNPQLTRTIINKIKDDEILSEKDVLEDNQEKTYQSSRNHSNSRYKYNSSGFESITRLKHTKVAAPRLAIGETNEIKSLIPTQPFCKLSSMDQSLFDIIVQFSQQYFTCYDKNRDELLAAYHPNALYSVSLNLKSQATVKSAKFDDSYFRDSRNLMFVTEKEKEFRMLHRGNFDIVASIKKMPYSEHDPNSLKLDVGFFQPMLVSFSITGVFREGKPDNPSRPYRNFQRTLICIPAMNNKMVILNEQFTISNLSDNQANRYKEEKSEGYKTQMTTETQEMLPPSFPTKQVLNISNDKQIKTTMINQFSQLSSLNLKWSQDVLEHSNWDLNAAEKNFQEHKNNIPKEAFL